MNKDVGLEKTFVQTADDKVLATTDHKTNNTDTKKIEPAIEVDVDNH